MSISKIRTSHLTQKIVPQYLSIDLSLCRIDELFVVMILIKSIICISWKDMRMEVPYVLIAGWLVMLSR